MKYLFVSLAFPVLLFSGCLGVGDMFSDKTIIGDFHEDTKFHNIIYQSLGILSVPILTWGNDTAYIILKTYKDAAGRYKPGDSLFFYIIDIRGYKAQPDQEKSPALFGPYNEKEFLQRKTELHIESIQFTEEDINA